MRPKDRRSRSRRYQKGGAIHDSSFVEFYVVFVAIRQCTGQINSMLIDYHMQMILTFTMGQVHVVLDVVPKPKFCQVMSSHLHLLMNLPMFLNWFMKRCSSQNLLFKIGKSPWPIVTLFGCLSRWPALSLQASRYLSGVSGCSIHASALSVERGEGCRSRMARVTIVHGLQIQCQASFGFWLWKGLCPNSENFLGRNFS